MARSIGNNRQKDVARVLREKLRLPRGAKSVFKVCDRSSTNPCKQSGEKQYFG